MKMRLFDPIPGGRFDREYKSVPSRSTIAQFWYYDVCKRFYKEGNKDKIPPFIQRFWIDVGEPVCWACGMYDVSWDYCNWSEADKSYGGMTHLFSNWNRLPLQRAHIIPKSLGGSNHPGNLVLICHNCHSLAPDVANPEFMLTWLNNREREYREYCIQKHNTACGELNIDKVKMAYMIYAIDAAAKREFGQYCDEFLTIHWGDGPEVKTSSIYASYISFFEKKFGDIDPREVCRQAWELE